MNQKIIAVLGLGYAGLPLALEFGRKFITIGYDLSERKVASYRIALGVFIDETGLPRSDRIRQLQFVTAAIHYELGTVIS